MRHLAEKDVAGDRQLRRSSARQRTLLLWIAAAILLFGTLAGAGEKPVYGSDDRREWDQADAQACATGRSTAAMMPAKNLTRSSGNRWLLTQAKTLAESNWCADERFADQPAVATCTAFLIGLSTVATAAHCINAADDSAGPLYNCSEVVFVFDYAMMDDGETRRRYQHDQIYYCKKIVAHHYTAASGDWAVIELDRNTTRAPLPLYRSAPATIGNQTLELVGHPLGLPLKWVRNGRVLKSENKTFTAAIDSFEGNSGSPILIRSERGIEVVGVLSKGERDYTIPKGNCLRTRICSGNCNGELVTRASEFAHLADKTTTLQLNAIATLGTPLWTSACL